MSHLIPPYKGTGDIGPKESRKDANTGLAVFTYERQDAAIWALIIRKDKGQGYCLRS